MSSKDLLTRKALRLEYFTVAWNVFEAAAAIAAAVMAGSVALLGFGLDSLIEVAAAAVLIWRLKKHGTDLDEESRAERLSLRFVGATFFLLAAYVAYEAIHLLWLRQRVGQSLVGIAITVLAALVMPILGMRKRQVAQELGSEALAEEGVESLMCGFMSLAVLLGLVLNYFWGFWWADPMASLVIAGFMVREGREAFEAGE